MFLTFVTTSLVLSQACSEWVEISQQHHYKKPIRPTHNHPLLATATTEVEKTKGNRIYLNHSLQEHNWNIDVINNLPNNNENGDKLESGGVNLKKNNGMVNKSPKESNGIDKVSVKSKEDSLLVRKAKPEEIKSVNYGIRQRTTIAGNVIRVRPISTEPTTTTTKRKPLNDLKGHNIEVLNLSDITGSGEKLKTEIGEEIVNANRRKHVASTTRAVNNRGKIDAMRQTKPPRTTRLPSENQKSEPKRATKTNKQETLLLKNNNMRRVEIIGNKPLAIKEFEENRGHNQPAVTEKPVIDIAEDTDKSTNYKLSKKEQTKRVQIVNNPENNKYANTELPIEEHYFTSDPRPNQIQNIVKTTISATTENVLAVKNKVNDVNSGLKNYELINTHRNPEEIMIEEILSEVKDIKVHKVASIGNVKRVSPKEIAKMNRHKDGPSTPSNPYTESTPEFETGDVFVEDEDFNDAYNEANTNAFFANTTKMPSFTTTKSKLKNNVTPKRPEVRTQIEGYGKNPYVPVRPSRESIPEFVTKDEEFDEATQFNDDFEFTTETNLKRLAIEASKKYSKNEAKDSDSATDNKDTIWQRNKNIRQEAKDEKPVTDDSKTSSMENLIKFLKTVTDIITKNTRRGVQGKMRYLEDLRDTILANIEERIEAAFPDDDGSIRRRARSTAEPRGHVEFPSSESALMSISFLTFAVFLIKLVLQVIQAYKNKTMMVVPTMVAAVGRAFSKQQSRP